MQIGHIERVLYFDTKLERSHVTDIGNQRVVVFDRKGRFLFQFGPPIAANKLVTTPLEKQVPACGYQFDGGQRGALYGLIGGDHATFAALL